MSTKLKSLFCLMTVTAHKFRQVLKNETISFYDSHYACTEQTPQHNLFYDQQVDIKLTFSISSFLCLIWINLTCIDQNLDSLESVLSQNPENRMSFFAKRSRWTYMYFTTIVITRKKIKCNCMSSIWSSYCGFNCKLIII